MKYFDIYLTDIPKNENQSQEDRDFLFTQIKRLAKDNEDLIDKGIYPVIICRYATEEESEFYKEFAALNNFTVQAKPIKSSVFDRFVEETKILEQEDSHLMSPSTIKEKLNYGLEVLQEYESSVAQFESSSDMILSKVRERKEMQVAKFVPSSCFLSFIIWACFALVFFLSKGFNLDSAFVVSLFFFGIMGATVIGDFVLFKKRLAAYFSPQGEADFWAVIEQMNESKNSAIHTVENMIDSLQARNCLTVLNVGKRNIETIEDVLDRIDVVSPNDLINLIC